MPRRLVRMAAAWAVLSLVAGGPALAQPATPGAGGGRPACGAGAVGIGDPYYPTMGNGGYDVRHYDLALDLDVAGGAIDAATATIAATATMNLCAFNLDFSGLEIDRVAVDGRPAGHLRAGGELSVEPAAPIAAGAPFVVEVAYHGTPRGRDATATGLFGGLFGPGGDDAATPVAGSATDADGAADQPSGVRFDRGWWTAPESIFVAGEPAGAETWYPVNGHPADKATYALRLTVDEPYAAAANGTLAETVDDGPTRTFVWTSRDPIASYLVTLHAGRLEIEEATGPNGLPIRYAFAASVPEEQRALYRRTPEILAHFETLFGPYPFEAAGATVVGAPLPFALETQTLPIFGVLPVPAGTPLSPGTVAAVEEVLAHELAHQWFGNTVSPLRWRDIWLNEGFASYADLLWLEHTQGEAARDEELERSYVRLRRAARWRDPATLATLNAGQVLEAYREEVDRTPDEAFLRAYREGLGAATDDDLRDVPAAGGIAQLAALGVPEEAFPGVVPLTGDPGAADLFSQSAVYNRGALTLHALRQEIGDGAFFAILRAWADRYRNGNAATADFVALTEEASGRELDAFFDAWLFRPGLPPLAFPEGAP